MNDTNTEPDTTTDSDSPASSTPRPRRLPVGPVGLLLITAVALAAATGAAWLVVDRNSGSDAVSIQEALDESTKAPIVVNPDVRAEVGKPAPDVRLDYLDGGTQQLAEVAGTGTPVVLNFWGSTCAPCIKEMPAMERVSNEFEGEVTFLGVDVADNVEDGEKMVRRTGVTYRNARDPRAEIAAVYGALTLPRTVLIGADGVVIEVHNGELTEEEIRALLVDNGFVGT